MSTCVDLDLVYLEVYMSYVLTFYKNINLITIFAKLSVSDLYFIEFKVTVSVV